VYQEVNFSPRITQIALIFLFFRVNSRYFSIFGGQARAGVAQQGHLPCGSPDRARLWLGHETGHSYLPLFIEKLPFAKPGIEINLEYGF